MNIKRLISRLVVFSLLVFAAAISLNAQERERDSAERRDQVIRQRGNELEIKLRQLRAQSNDINAALEKLKEVDGRERKEYLLAAREKVNAEMAEIKAAFAEMRARNQELERRRERTRDRERELQLQRERRWEREGDDDEEDGEDEDEDENKEIRAARNQLKHLKHAYEHLREAGMDELAQAVGARYRKIESAIQRYEERRERSEREEEEEDELSESDDSFRKEVTGAIRELNAAVRSLRKEVERLKRDR